MGFSKVILSVPSIFGYEEVVAETVGTVARVQRLPFEKVSKLKTAVAEACINAIEHGNKQDPTKQVSVSIEFNTSEMHVSIHDHGEGMPPPKFEIPDIRKQIEERQLGGWGLYLMRTLVDKIQIDSSPENGTTTTLTIQHGGDSPCKR